MTRRKLKRPITWLLIAGMLHLMLIAAPGGMVMAGPSQSGETAPMHSMDPTPHRCAEEMAAMVWTAPDCNGCGGESCNRDCPLCIQLHFSLQRQLSLPVPERENPSGTPFFSRLIDPGHAPPPPPPRRFSA